MVKNPIANAGDMSDMDWTPESGRPPEEAMTTHSSILAWRIPWTEVDYRAWGCKELEMTEVT